MKNKTWVKICSVALSLIMSLSMVGGLFVSAESAATVDDSDFVVVDGKNPVTGTAVGATTTAKTTAGTTTTTPTVDANATYDTWDGTYDTEWEAVEGKDNAFYISSAEELFGLKKQVKELGLAGTVAKVEAGVAKYEKDLAAYNAGTTETAPTFPFATGSYISGGYVQHVYSGYTFYLTANIDMTGHDWDGLGSCINWFGFDGDIYGWDKEANTAKSVYIKGMNLVPADDATTLELNYTTADGAAATVTLSGGISRIGFIATHSGSKVENLTFVAPTATVATGSTGFVVGTGRTGTSSYENVHVVDGVLTFNSNYSNVGGFIGIVDTNNTYTGCSVDVEFKYGFTGYSGTKYNHGGFMGYINNGTDGCKNTFTDCYVNLVADNDAVGYQTFGGYVGAIGANAGKGNSASFVRCDADIYLNAAGGGEAVFGGYVGWLNDAAGSLTITDSKVEGTVKYKSNTKTVGGFVGTVRRAGSTFELKNSYSDVSISATKLEFTGGVTGYTSTSYITVDNCVCNTSITSTGTTTYDGFIGGAIGRMEYTGPKITNSEFSVAFNTATMNRATFGGVSGGGAASTTQDATNRPATLIDNCTVHLDIDASSAAGTSDEFRSGGILSYSSSKGKYTISDCVVDGTLDVTGGGVQNFGGVACVMQLADQKITNCVSSIDITTAGKSYGIGGIVGVTSGAATFNVSDCLWNGKMSISAENFDGTGGIWGYAATANAVLNISNCVADGTFESTGDTSYLRRCGGIVGSLNQKVTANITNCESYCDFVQNGSSSYISKNAQILADSRYATATITIDGCTAGGTLTSDATSGEALGGITGYLAGPFTVKNSISNMDFYMTCDLDKTTAQAQIGGISGQIPVGSTATIQNCYYGGTVNVGDVGKQVGGFIGNLSGIAIIENSQMEGVLSSTSTQTGAIVGRFQTDATEGVASLTLNNVVVSGIAAGSSGYGIIGLAASNGSTTGKATLNYTNVSSQISLPVILTTDWANIEASDNGTPDDTTDDIKEDKDNVTLTINGGSPVINESAEHWVDEVTDVVAEVEFDSSVWTADGATPVLTVAKDADRLWASADITWFDPAALLEEDFYFENEDQVYGYAMLSNVAKFRSAFVGKEFKYVAKTDCLVENVVADKAFYKGAELVPTHYCAHNDETDTHGKAIPMATLDVQFQLGAASSVMDENFIPVNTYNIRVLAAVTDTTGYDSVGFLVTFNGETVRLTTHTVYASVIGTSSDMGLSNYTANGVFGDEAKFMFATTFLNMPETDEFTIQAFAVVNGIEKTGAAETWTVSNLVAKLTELAN